MERNDRKTNADICRIVRKHLSEEEIEKNYQTACKKIFPDGIINTDELNKVTKECRKMALRVIPKEAFNPVQKFYIRKHWGINI